MINKSDIISAYLIGVPVAVTLIFTYFAIIHHGMMTFDMTKYGEYEIEIFMLTSWVLLLIFYLIKLEIKHNP